MSPGDQVISVLIDSIGTLISAIISSVFSAIFTPLLESIIGLFGVPLA
jgi:hypothetical protein